MLYDKVLTLCIIPDCNVRDGSDYNLVAFVFDLSLVIRVTYGPDNCGLVELHQHLAGPQFRYEISAILRASTCYTNHSLIFLRRDLRQTKGDHNNIIYYNNPSFIVR